MATLNYSEVFSRFYSKVEAYDLFEEGISEETRNEFLCSYLHSSVSEPYTHRLFSEVVMTDSHIEIVDDEPVFVDGTIEFTMKYPTDEDSDNDFMAEILGCGMALAWVEPKVASLPHIRHMIGTSNEKYYSQAAHLSELRSFAEDLNTKQRKMIRDRGSANNRYLDGKIREKS